MAFPLNDEGVYEISIIGKIGQDAVINVVHYRYEQNNEPVPSTMTNGLVAILNEINTAILNSRTNNFEMVKYVMKHIIGVTLVPGPPDRYIEQYGAIVENVSIAGIPGDLIPPSLPNYVAATLNKPQEDPIPRLRGRFMNAPLPEAWTDDVDKPNELTVAALAVLNTLGATMNNKVSVGTQDTLDPVVFSRKIGTQDLPGSTKETFDWVADKIVGSQLSRKRRRTLI